MPASSSRAPLRASCARGAWCAACALCAACAACAACFICAASAGCEAVEGVDASDAVDATPHVAPSPALVLAPCEPRGFECGTLRVPRDPDVDDGATLELAVRRRAAPGTHARLGVLVVNLGGPAPSLPDFEWFTKVLPVEVRNRFDIVSFDERGVGASVPAIKCDPLEEELARIGVRDITNPGQLERDIDDLTSVARVCTKENDGLFRILGTRRSVEDLDLLRDALGEDQISFYGASYGTLLGAGYAIEHPGRLRALVIDSVVRLAPSFDDVERAPIIKPGPDAKEHKRHVPSEAEMRRVTRIFDAIRALYDACDADPRCPARPGSMKRANAVDELAKDGALPGFDKYEPSMLRDEALRSGPSAQRRFLAAIAETDPAKIAEKLSALRASLKPDDARQSVFNFSVRCADGLVDEAFLDQVFVDVVDESVRVPRCAVLGIEPDPIRFSIVAPPKVFALVLTPKNDLRTPAVFARTAARWLGAPLVTWDGIGHGALAVSPCAKDIFERTLIDHERPTDDVTCAR